MTERTITDDVQRFTDEVNAAAKKLLPENIRFRTHVARSGQQPTVVNAGIDLFYTTHCSMDLLEKEWPNVEKRVREAILDLFDEIHPLAIAD